MKKTLILYLVLIIYNTSFAQKFDVDTILYNGDPNRYINIVIVPDGYTQQEFAALDSDAAYIRQFLFDEEPYKSYKNYFNLFLLKVPSLESGINHPRNASDEGSSQFVPVLIVNNYFKSTLDKYIVHRSIGPLSNNSVIKVLADNVPQYDFALVLNNTPYHGGTASSGIANVTKYPGYLDHVTIHELGHTLGNLLDEYWPESGISNEGYNSTQNSNPQTIKWKEWLGINNIGINSYCCGPSSNLWYKPSTTCVMEKSNSIHYCSVCREGVIEQIHNLFWPIESSIPDNKNIIYTRDTGVLSFSVKLNQPSSPTIKSYWLLNTDTIAGGNTYSITISQSDPKFKQLYNELKFVFIDTSALIKETDHFNNHLYSVTWRLITDCKITNPIPYSDTLVCMGSLIKITNNYPNEKFWSTYDTASSVYVVADKDKELWTYINYAGYSCYDTVHIKTMPISQSLSKDTVLCEGVNAILTDKLIIADTGSTIKRLWFTGDSTKAITALIDSLTNYWISFKQNNTVCYDSIKIKVSPKIKTTKIQGPATLKPNKKAIYQVDSSSNYFIWTINNGYLTTVQYKHTMEILAKQSGQINLKVVERNDYCVDSSEILIDIEKPAPTGIENRIKNNKPLFYPNPTTGTIFYDLQNNTFISFTFFDLAGKEVLHHKPTDENTGSIDISTLSNGIYTLTLLSKTAVLTYKIVIHK